MVSSVKCLLLQSMNCRSPKENLLNFSRVHLETKIFLGWRAVLPLGLISARQWLSPALSLPMPPKDNNKKKEAGKTAKKGEDPVNKSRVKARKKWSKGKVPDKAAHDKLWKEVPNYKLITPAVVS